MEILPKMVFKFRKNLILVRVFALNMKVTRILYPYLTTLRMKSSCLSIQVPKLAQKQQQVMTPYWM